MKKLKLLAAVCACYLSTNAQTVKQLSFEIDPYVVQKSVITGDTSFITTSDTCEIITFRVVYSDLDSAAIAYDLKRQDRSVYETGVKKIPIEALVLIATKPYNMAALNSMLAQWHIEAIKLEGEE